MANQYTSPNAIPDDVNLLKKMVRRQRAQIEMLEKKVARSDEFLRVVQTYCEMRSGPFDKTDPFTRDDGAPPRKKKQLIRTKNQ